MNNYEKAKQEGMEEFKEMAILDNFYNREKGRIELPTEDKHLFDSTEFPESMYELCPDKITGFLSSFAEKIKDGVERDRGYIVTETFEESGKTTDGKTLYWTKAYKSSDSQTIK